VKQAYFRPLIYFFFWLLVSVIIKALFIIYHFPKTAELTFSEISKVFLYGLRMDASFSAYLCVIPFFCFLMEGFFKNLRLTRWVYFFTLLCIIIVSGLVTADLELYNAWGYRLDATPLQYLNTPQEMLASVSAAPVLLLTVLFFLQVFLFSFFTGALFSHCWRKKLILPFRQPVK